MNENYTPGAGREYRYAVLTRPGSVQVLVRPTARDLRENGEQGWALLRTIEDQADAWRMLQETLQAAVPDTDAALQRRRPEGAGLYPMDLDAWCQWTLD